MTERNSEFGLPVNDALHDRYVTKFFSAAVTIGCPNFLTTHEVTFRISLSCCMDEGTKMLRNQFLKKLAHSCQSNKFS